jgi:hypothetical protein
VKTGPTPAVRYSKSDDGRRTEEKHKKPLSLFLHVSASSVHSFGFSLENTPHIRKAESSHKVNIVSTLDALTPALDPRLRRLILYKSAVTMSDLAPFVASVLYKRALAETKQEVDHLSEQLQKSRAVQIISASGTVYAEGHFQDGSYSSNPSIWFVNLPK